MHALRSRVLRRAAGEVHALVGENGAGKSTLIKLLGGRLRPDSGTSGSRAGRVRLSGPQRAHGLGAWTVFQELTLLPWMTVAENLLLRREPRGPLGLISRRPHGRSAEAMLAGMGIDHIDPLALIEDISLAQRQIVEIVRAIVARARHPVSGRADLLAGRTRGGLAVRRRSARCATAARAWSSPRIAGTRSQNIADRITIFRNGRDVGTFTEIDESEAVTLMTGQRVETLLSARCPPLPARARRRCRSGPAGPRVARCVVQLLRARYSASAVWPGMAIASCSSCCSAPSAPRAGTIAVDGRPRAHQQPARRNRAHGMALVPEDRKTEGLLLAHERARQPDACDPATACRALGVLRRAAERRCADDMVDATEDADAGHRQSGRRASPAATSRRCCSAAGCCAEPRILLLYDVTRGVDVATKHEIYELMMRLAAEGSAILFYSSDAEELAHLCHRVLVMREGRIAAELAAPAITAEQIVAAAVRDRMPPDAHRRLP